jgi:Tol biopolymer transport system component
VPSAFSPPQELQDQLPIRMKFGLLALKKLVLAAESKLAAPCEMQCAPFKEKSISSAVMPARAPRAARPPSTEPASIRETTYRQAPSELALDEQPSRSADGAKIAFQSKRDGTPEIYLMNNDGTNQRRLTFNTKQDAEPAWSPNGQKLTFLSDRDGTLNVWVMDSSGVNQKQLTSTSQPDGTPSFSPDRTKILSASKRGTTGEGTVFDIYTMNPDGSNIVLLTNSKSGDFEPSWSRDGTKVALTGARDGNHEIYPMNANGSGQSR